MRAGYFVEEEGVIEEEICDEYHPYRLVHLCVFVWLKMRTQDKNIPTTCDTLFRSFLVTRAQRSIPTRVRTPLAQ
jgi:hypothetical protein